MPVATATGPPAAPENFHVEKIIGNSSLMLAWEPVPLDNTGTSNGVKVTGYKVSYQITFLKRTVQCCT
jgi:hypothetical protein